jgi:hypothetical protein
MCERHFQPDAKQTALIAKSRAKGMAFVVLDCPHCRCGAFVMLKEPASESVEANYRCPVAGCSGWVCFVEGDKKAKKKEKPFWGCGECGSFWIKLENLRKEIEAIVKKYPYRKKSYRKLKGEWHPADPGKEREDYDELVEAEPMDEAKSFKRG